MRILYKSIFTGMTLIILNFPNSYATEVFGGGEDVMHQRTRSQFDLRLAENYLKEEKEEARKLGYQQGMGKGIEQGIEQGIERGIERGRMEHLKQVVSTMMNMGLSDNMIAEANQLTEVQLREVKESLNK